MDGRTINEDLAVGGTKTGTGNLSARRKPAPVALCPLFILRHLTQGSNPDMLCNHLCGLVIRVLGYTSRGPGSISGATKFPEK
jgi:hypothetical protein